VPLRYAVQLLTSISSIRNFSDFNLMFAIIEPVLSKFRDLLPLLWKIAGSLLINLGCNDILMAMF
jgi:uncharacterized protein YggT (Ycf19 family)